MTRTPYPGGSYADALPSGEFAVLFVDAYINTHLGIIDLPTDDEPLYFGLAGRGVFLDLSMKF